jgi:glycosidase
MAFAATLPVQLEAQSQAINVATESADPASIVTFYKRLLYLRHQEKALIEGEYIPLDENNPNPLSFLRRFKNEGVLVVLNMSATEQKATLDLTPQGFAAASRAVLLTTGRGDSISGRGD